MRSRKPFGFKRVLGVLAFLWLAGFLICDRLSAEEFIIARGGEPACVILISPLAPEKVIHAAEELKLWVGKVTGAELPVMSVDKWDEKTAYIAVGESTLTRANGWCRRPFAQEEARIFIESGKVGLLGDDVEPLPGIERQGTYFAVLEFVRTQLGVRWIWPGEIGAVYRPHPTLAIEPAQWSWKPDILFLRSIRNGYRMLRNRTRMEEVMERLSASNEAWEQMAAEHDEWLRRQRMNPSRMRVFGHAFSKWWEKYGERHPDWFALPPPGVSLTGSKNSKLNLSNPEVQDNIFNEWHARWKENPAANRYLNICPNDGRGFDTRPETRAWDAPELASLSAEEIYGAAEPVLSDRHVRFANILARRVREVDPLAFVTTYAYRNYQAPPLTSIQVEPNVIIEYCAGEGYYPDERYIVDEWVEWSRRGALLCWRPNFLNTGHAGPYLFSKQLYEDFQTLRQHSLLGTDFDTLWGNWAGQGLVYYVLAELHSRPDASYEELANEYYSAFGPARDAVRAYHEYFEEVTRYAPRLMREHGLVSRPTWGGWWEAQIRVIPLLLSPEVLATGEELIRRAELEVAKGTEIERKRVAIIAKEFRHSSLMAETFRRLNLHDPKTQVRGGGNRTVLKPLWDLRRKELINLGQSYITLFMEEQRALGLWTDYFEHGDSNQEEAKRITTGWRGIPDPNDNGLENGWYNGDSVSWAPIDIGQPWRKAMKDVPETEVFWYAVGLAVPDLADTGERVALRFDSIDEEVDVWINGKRAGERRGGDAQIRLSWQEGFELDVTEAVRSGAMNQLAVRVKSSSANGGITGPVFMIFRK